MKAKTTPIQRNNYSYQADRPCLVCAHRHDIGPKCLTCFHYSADDKRICKDVFTTPYKRWSPAEVRKIRKCLGKSKAEFGDMFYVSEATVESWERKVETEGYREVYGSDARLMWVAAELAKGRKMTLFRLAASGEL